MTHRGCRPRCSGLHDVTAAHTPTAPRPPVVPVGAEIREFGLLLTRVCNAACAHCGSRAGPHHRGHIPRAYVERSVADVAALGVRTVMISGGEPFVVFDELAAAAELAHDAGLGVQVCSNGWFGTDPDRARTWLAALAERGLEQLLLSTDRFHLAHVPLTAVIGAAHAAEELGIPCQIAVPATARDWQAPGIVAALQQQTRARVTMHAVHPVGRGEDLPAHHFRWPRPRIGPCDLVGHVEVAQDGTVSVCPTSAEFGAASPMILGNVATDRLADLLRDFQHTPLFAVLARWGPSGLHALAITDDDVSADRDQPLHDCQLCRRLTADTTVLDRIRAATGIELTQPVDDDELHRILGRVAARLPAADGSPAC